MAVENAVADSKRLGAVLVFESTTRMLRNRFYSPNSTTDALPTQFEFDKFLKLLDGVPTYTLCPPSATPNEIRSFETKRGQTEKQKRGGRPRAKRAGYKKQIRVDLLPEARRLKNVEGLSLREIGKRLGVAHTTAADWLRGK